MANILKLLDGRYLFKRPHISVQDIKPLSSIREIIAKSQKASLVGAPFFFF